MTDTLTRSERSERMRRIKSRDTRPELQLRRLVWALGHRYRKSQRTLIGKPDVAFIGRKRAIFLHGCFWHRHDCRSGKRAPKTRIGFWSKKFNENTQRDARVMRELETTGWKAMVVWECELRDQGKVERRLRRFLDA